MVFLDSLDFPSLSSTYACCTIIIHYNNVSFFFNKYILLSGAID